MPKGSGSPRITQKQLAELAGVSQAAVSMILSGSPEVVARIPESTRRRVEEISRTYDYVADPAARRLRGQDNNILGVFTYEHAFPRETADFYMPLLTGIEAAAEQRGCDLLVFTSAPVTGGRRKIFHDNNRLRLADGCLLLGREMDSDELGRLAAGTFPFVAIGRRDTPPSGGVVPYVGADYATAVRTLAAAALELGHRRFLYLALPERGESGADRRAGFDAAIAGSGATVTERVAGPGSPADDWEAVRAAGVTVVFAEDPGMAIDLYAQAKAAGAAVPGEVSVVALGDLPRHSQSCEGMARLVPPREEMASRAVQLLVELIKAGPDSDMERQFILPCECVLGRTLVPPPGAGPARKPARRQRKGNG
jgi:DNA-binding LacI/PurR family transcriptional regulator